MLDRLRLFQNALLKTIKTKYKRYFYGELINDEKLLAIVGARGVGKTTTLLQYLKEHKFPNSKKLYISVDWFDSKSLFDVAHEFYKNGGKLLIIDEIHKYPKFEKELKNIYDILDMRVIISGSSALSINHAKADLSRRLLKKEVKGLSFREFLEFKYKTSFKTYTLDDMLQNHVDIAYEILQNIELPSIEPDFKEYLQIGYYPFYFQNKDSSSYLLKLKETINIVLEVDIPTITNIRYATIKKFKKLIEFICVSSPYTPNMQTLLSNIDMHKNEYSELYMYLDFLQKAKILRLCKSANKKDKILTKPEKIYLNNTNLHFAYCNNSEIGTLRESFFASMMEDYELYIPKQGDFLVDEKYIFEVGGAKKSFKQIKDIPNSYVVSDDFEIGSGNKIPLWLFGFLY
ncbi:MAG: ATP-binding protein [Epsilonproteobacteria bacterium]|nr:ATP-binding protein [Campylobacterota bacterium]